MDGTFSSERRWLTAAVLLHLAISFVHGAAHACAVSNCTTALHLALKAVGVGPGDEVITVSHSFIATANAVRYCGAVPVFVDVRADTFNLDERLIEAAITPRTRAIVPVHYAGVSCAMDVILEIAKRHLLPKLVRENGLEALGLTVTDDAIFKVIHEYAREAGLRNFERDLANLLRTLGLWLWTIAITSRRAL